MRTEIEKLLRQAQAREASGDLAGAVTTYQTLLKRFPNAVAAHLGLADVWQRADLYRKSLTSLRAAADCVARSGRWDALPFVTMRLLAFGERRLIQKLILAADWKQPAVIRQSPTLSQHLWLSGAYDAALDLIAAASALVPANPLLSYSRANALRYSGRMQEATEELERCLQTAPDFAFAHWSLAQHARSGEPGQRVDRIRRALLSSATDPVAQIHLQYALFRELDEAGDTAAAWEALQEGARLKRRTVVHDAQQESASIEALCAFAEAGGGALPDSGVSHGHAPIFIVGMPRSGTTLLERILSNHEQVATAGELGDLAQALSWAADRFISSPPGRPMVDSFATLDPGMAGDVYLERTAGFAAGRAFLVDKNPSNLFHVWAIARALPAARVLCLVRDPMDACFSNLKELFSGDAYAYSYDQLELAAHHRCFSRVVDCWQSLFPSRFRTVVYEELVARPDSVAADVARFCGLESSSGMTDVASNASPVLSASYAQVRDGVHTRNIGAWRRYADRLEPLEQALASG